MLLQGQIHILVHSVRPGGQRAVKVLFNHGHRAADQVAQVVSQVGVYAGEEGLVGVVTVRAEGHFAQQIIAQRVRAVARHNGLGVYHIALGLAHLIIAKQQPAVGEHLLGQGQTQRVQHDRPVNGVEAHDFLANQMHICRPVLAEQMIIGRIIAQGGDVVGQRVDPHIDHMLGIKVHRHAPLEAGAGYAQILQAGLEKIVDHLVGAGSGLDEIGMRLQIVQQPILIFAHAEEVAFLLHGLHGTAAVRAALDAVLFYHLRGGPEGLAGRAVQTLIGALVDIALLVELAENLLHNLFVTLVGGADEVVVFHLHQLPQILGVSHDFIHISLGGNALFLGLALDLLAVLVRAGQKIGIVALHFLKARHGVGRHGGVGVTDVHVAAGIIDGGGDVIGFLFRHRDIPPISRVKARIFIFFRCRCFQRRAADGQPSAHRPPAPYRPRPRRSTKG